MSEILAGFAIPGVLLLVIIVSIRISGRIVTDRIENAKLEIEKEFDAKLRRAFFAGYRKRMEHEKAAAKTHEEDDYS